MIGHYNTIAVGSKDPAILGRRFEFPVSANELVEGFLSHGTLNDELPRQPASWLERFFADTMAWLHQHALTDSSEQRRIDSPFGRLAEPPPMGDIVIPTKTFGSVMRFATTHQLSAIVLIEGAGKTSTLLDVMLDDEDDYRLLHPGFIVVACRSYEQAQRKCSEFNACKGPEKGFRGVVLRSFDEVVKEIVPGFHSSAERAAREGFSSEIEAVYSDPSHGGAVVALDQHRQQIQHELAWRGDQQGVFDWTVRDSVVVFTTHGLVQNWYHPGGTRYWLHPRFPEWLQARADLDYKTEQRLGKEIRYETQFSWVLHDECTMTDLLTMHPEKDARWVNDFTASVPKFKSLGMTARLEAFENYHGGSAPVSFDEMLSIAEARYEKQDLFTANPALESLGINNSPASPYVRFKEPDLYVKNRDWWNRNTYRLTIMTTERKIRMALDQIRRKQIEQIELHPKHGPALLEWRSEIDTLGITARPEVPAVWSIIDLPVADYLSADRIRVQIYLDDRARAEQKDKQDRPFVRHIYEEIKASQPDAIIIGNKSEHYGITPNKAKGLNDYIGKKIYYIMMFSSPEQYRDLLIENAVFGTRNCVHLHLLDEFDQIVGRSLGFRYRPGSEVIVIMPARLWRDIGFTLLTQSNYGPAVVTDRPW
jgi:hypothetical protein